MIAVEICFLSVSYSLATSILNHYLPEFRLFTVPGLVPSCRSGKSMWRLERFLGLVHQMAFFPYIF